MNKLNSAPIGIFDSGIGGLTVAKSVMEALPKEDIIYFGDTARVPYGIKSEETVQMYALQITNFLLKKGVKMILIACNTVSASAKEQIIKLAGNIPVLDVITAGTYVATNLSKHTRIAVIGTLATVNSQAYIKAITKIDPEVEVIQQACPLLVPLAEEGWIDNEVAKQTLSFYLEAFKGKQIDSLILGCTHYPLFKSVITDLINGGGTNIVDSADSIATTAQYELNRLGLLNDDGGAFKCFVSDRPQRFQELAERFLGRSVSEIEIVSL